MKNRNPLAVFFFSIITFGIYDLYWLTQTKKVLNEKTKYHTPSIWLLVAPVPVIVLGYILLFAAGGGSTSSTTTTTVYGTTTTTYGSGSGQLTHPGEFWAAFAVIFIGFAIEIVISLIWFFKFSKAINAYTNGKMSTAVTFLILWLIHLIGVALIQDTFNDMSEFGTSPAQAVPVAAGAGTPPAPTSSAPAATTMPSSDVTPAQSQPKKEEDHKDGPNES